MYRNNGDNSFTKISNISFEAKTYWGAISWLAGVEGAELISSRLFL